MGNEPIVTLTPITVTRRQAADLLLCVRFAQEHGGGDNLHDLPPLDALYGLERMMLAVLERIRDLEARRSHA